MKFIKTMGLAALLAGATILGSAQQKDNTSVSAKANVSPIEYIVEANRFSTWYYNGIKLSSGSTDQAIAQAKYGCVTGKSFLNYDEGKEKITEVDLSTALSFRLSNNLGISGGYIHRFMPNTGFDHSQETFLAARLESYVNTEVIGVNDLRKGGLFCGINANKTFDFLGFPLTFQASAGYNRHYWSEGEGWSHVELSGKMSVPVDNFTVTPLTGYTFPLNEKHNLEKDMFLGLNVKGIF